MLSLTIFGLFYATILNLAEAKIDSLEKAINGEPYDHHKKVEPYWSFAMYFVYPFMLFLSTSEINVYKLIFLWVGIRSFFDFMYNFYRDFHWSYLGTTATTDGILKRFNPYLLLVVRLSVLTTTILFAIC